MSLVTEYQSRWPDDYRRVRDYILTGLRTFESIEHFGGTSIPGMVAKPIIDIMIVVPRGEMGQAIAELGELEYRHQGDLGIRGREAYDYLPRHIDLPRHHLYTCYPDHPHLHGLRAFREFLKENREWRERLSNLKLELDERFDSDRQKYMDGKKALVEKIIGMAKKEFPGHVIPRITDE